MSTFHRAYPTCLVPSRALPSRLLPQSVRFLLKPVFLTCLVVIGSLGPLSPRMFAGDGPTPYPDAKDEAAWPGKGPIRFFWWMPEKRKSFWTQREKDAGAIVLVGDSLTEGWKTPLLVEAFPGVKIANRGIGGDTSRGVLFRFKEDVLDLKPRAIMLLVGVNDLTAHGDPAATEQNIAAMLDMAKAQDPSIPVILCQLPPSANPQAPLKPGAATDLNNRIGKLGEGRANVTVVNLYKVFSTPEGTPIPEYYVKDMLHLSGEGYKKWLEAIKPAFEKLGLDKPVG